MKRKEQQHAFGVAAPKGIAGDWPYKCGWPYRAGWPY